MKRKVLSLLLSVALCITVVPDTAYATATVSGNEAGQPATVSNDNEVGETETATDENENEEGRPDTTVSGNSSVGDGNEQTKCTAESVGDTALNEKITAVQDLINALPALEELQATDKQKQQEIYEALQEAYDAYEALSEEDKALLVGADCFETLFGWFNAQVSPLGETESHSHCICGLTHEAIGDHTTESVQTWTAITDTDNDGIVTMTELHDQIKAGGYFYLTADVVQGNMEDKLIVNVGGVTAICLNGYEMKLNSWYSEGIYLNKASNDPTKLILTDCGAERKGAITFPSEDSSNSMFGVRVQNGASFEMYGGSIKGMRYSQGGAGVRCTGYQSSFKMYGGSIQGNNNTYSYTSGECGAAVYCNDSTSFTMYGGTITRNTHQNGSGGGVYCGTNSTFTMLGGEIRGNTAALNGGGVLVDGSMTIGGTAKITGNTAGGKTGNLFLNGSNSVLNVKADFTGEVGLAAFDGVDRQIVSREEGSAGTITYDADGYTLDTNGTLKLDHTHAPGEGTTDRCATCNGLLVASVTPQTGAASYYTKLDYAMKAVTEGATVKLLRSADYAGNLEITQPMTLDLNGKWFYTVEGDVFIHAADVKVLGNASTVVGGRLARKTWKNEYYETSVATVTIGSTGENAVPGGLTLSNQGTVGVVTVLNGTFTMTDGSIYGLVSNKKGDTKLSGGTISEDGSGITIKGEGYAIRDLLAEERVLLAVKGGTSSPVTEEQLAGTTLTTSSGTTSYKIAKPGFESVSISGGNQTVRYGETAKVTLTAVPVMAEGYNLEDVIYRWELDGKEVQNVSTRSYAFKLSNFGSKAPAEGGTEPAPYVITCTMTCGGYSQTAETTITVLPKKITAGTGNVTLGSGAESFTYTGSALTPAVTLKDGEDTVSPTEYELNYSNNLNVGTATVTFKDKPGGKYTVSGSVKFNIEKAENTTVINADAKASVASYGYGGTLPTPQLTHEPTGGTVTYYYNTTDSTTDGTPWSELTSKTFLPGDTTYYLYAVVTWDNYKTFTTPTTSFKVNKIPVPVTTWPTVKDVYVGDTLNADYIEGGSTDITGNFSITGNTSFTASGTKTTTLTFTASGTDANYYEVNTKEISVNVIKRTLQSAQSQTAITGKSLGTPLDKLGLAEKVEVTTADGKKYQNIPVTWSGYNPKSLKAQVLTGTLDIASIETYVEQPATPVTVSVSVTLELKANENFPTKKATYSGRAIAYDGGMIPEGVASVTYEYEGTDGTAYERTETPPTNAGKYTVIVSFTMAEGEEQLLPVGTRLEIAKSQTPSKYEVTIEDFDYGSPSTPGLSPVAQDRTVTYYYSASNHTNAEQSTKWTEDAAKKQSVGTYYLFAVIAENENYLAYTTPTKEFHITKADPVIQWPTVNDVYVGDTLDTSYLVVGNKLISGNFTITGTKSWTESGRKTTTLTFTSNPENTNYEKTMTKEVSVNVIKRSVLSTNPSNTTIADKEYGTALSDLGLPKMVKVVASANNATRIYENIPVSWSGYNSQSFEIQHLTGTLDISAYSKELEQPQTPVTVSATVQLQKRTAPTPNLTDKNVVYSAGQQGLVFDTMPEGVASVQYEYEGTNGTEYAKATTPPTNVGSYTVTAKFTMKKEYNELAPVTATLTITQLGLEGAEVVLGGRLEANGRQQTQTVATVKVAGVTLPKTDYTVTGNTGTAVGRYTMTISGVGNCTGEVEKEWNIYKKEQKQEKKEAAVEETGNTGGTGGAQPESTSNWQAVNKSIQELNALTPGKTTTNPERKNINVNTPGKSEVPAYVLETLKGTGLTLALQQGNGVALSISGDAIGKNTLAGLQTLELTTDTNAKRIPESLIREKRSNVNRQIAIKDTGRFPVPVNLHINMGAENAGRYANFYRYNETLGRLEYCGSFKITEIGQAMAALKQGGSYLINVTDKGPAEKIRFTGGSYMVRSGDTLGKIAAAYRMSVRELLSKNPAITDANRIRTGQEININ